MKIIAIETELPGVTSEKFTPEILKAEAEKAWQLQQAGIIREIYFQKEQHIAVLILECADETEAEKYLSTLPLVKEQLISFKLFPLVPYDGYSRLFSDN